MASLRGHAATSPSEGKAPSLYERLERMRADRKTNPPQPRTFTDRFYELNRVRTINRIRTHQKKHAGDAPYPLTELFHVSPRPALEKLSPTNPIQPKRSGSPTFSEAAEKPAKVEGEPAAKKKKAGSPKGDGASRARRDRKVEEKQENAVKKNAPPPAEEAIEVNFKFCSSGVLEGEASGLISEAAALEEEAATVKTSSFERRLGAAIITAMEGRKIDDLVREWDKNGDGDINQIECVAAAICNACLLLLPLLLLLGGGRGSARCHRAREVGTPRMRVRATSARGCAGKCCVAPESVASRPPRLGVSGRFRACVRNSLKLKAENKECDTFFNSMDSDGGGSLDLAELKGVLKAVYKVAEGADAEAAGLREKAAGLRAKAERVREVATATSTLEAAEARIKQLSAKPTIQQRASFASRSYSALDARVGAESLSLRLAALVMLLHRQLRRWPLPLP